MIDEQNLRELLGDLESDRVERTVSTGDTDKFCQAICAFANDMPGNNRPGYLVVGAADRDGAIGAHFTAVSKCYMDFRALTQGVLCRTSDSDAG